MWHCRNRGAGELKISTANLRVESRRQPQTVRKTVCARRPVILRILEHLGLNPRLPPKSRARETAQPGQHCAARAAPAIEYRSRRAALQPAGRVTAANTCARRRPGLAQIRVKLEVNAKTAAGDRPQTSQLDSHGPRET